MAPRRLAFVLVLLAPAALALPAPQESFATLHADEDAVALVLAPDGDVLVLTQVGGGALLRRFSPAGGELWARGLDDDARASALALTPAGDAVAALRDDGAAGVASVAPDGAVLQPFLLPLAEPAALAIAPDGDLLLAGGAEGDGYVARVSAKGAVLWVRALHGEPRAVAVGDEERTLVAGDRDDDAWVRAFDAEGGALWTVPLDGPRIERARALVALPGGGFVVAGSVASAPSDGSAPTPRAHAALDEPTLERRWLLPLGAGGASTALAVARDPWGNVLVAGEDQGHAFVTKLDAGGGELWAASRANAAFSSVAADASGLVVAAGDANEGALVSGYRQSVPRIELDAPRDAMVGRPVTFTAPGSSEFVSWTWEFGDGATATGSPVQHLYAASGDYLVRLAGRTEAGIEAIDHAALRVAPLPEPLRADLDEAPALVQTPAESLPAPEGARPIVVVGLLLALVPFAALAIWLVGRR